MNKTLIYCLAALMTACATDTLAPIDIDESGNADDYTGMMIFMPRAAVLSRASSNGLYNQSYYPVNSLFLTAYHRDNLDLTQWYFKDIKLDALNSKYEKLEYNGTILEDGTDQRFWLADQWYWPIQGKMEFLSYWSPKVYGSPTFYEYVHADGGKSAQMVVNARGVYNGEESLRYEGLDGYTDFLYIAQNNIPCPQTQPFGLLYRHGLSWITLSLQATVPQYDSNGNVILDANGEPLMDVVETNKLIDAIKVQKIVIEDVSRKGVAYLVPGLPVAWTINDEDIQDQMYTRPVNSSYPRGTYAYFTWEQVADARAVKVDEFVTLSPNRQYLGLYTPSLYSSTPDSYNPDDHTTEYVGNGLFIIPQHKTAITVYFLIKNGRKVYDADGNPTGELADLEVAKKYDLHDNNLEWEPGMRYHYDIVFTSSVDNLENKFEVQLVETTYELLIDPVTTCYDEDAFGELITTGTGGSSSVTFKAATFVLDPLHNQGSPFSDEMDYLDGGQVF